MDGASASPTGCSTRPQSPQGIYPSLGSFSHPQSIIPLVGNLAINFLWEALWMAPQLRLQAVVLVHNHLKAYTPRLGSTHQTLAQYVWVALWM